MIAPFSSSYSGSLNQISNVGYTRATGRKWRRFTPYIRCIMQRTTIEVEERFCDRMKGCFVPHHLGEVSLGLQPLAKTKKNGHQIIACQRTFWIFKVAQFT